MADIVVRIDRIQLASWAPLGSRPPALNGFKVTRDSFIRCQTNIKAYERCREYRCLSDDSRIFWQYHRLKSWLRAWRISLIADDRAGLSYTQIETVLSHCQYFHFLTVEVALDFKPSAGVDTEFVRRHANFGKSRRSHGKSESPLYWGGRKSDKLVRCYKKKLLARYRVELELHSQLLKREQISTLDDFDGIPDAIYPRHIQFVDVDWRRLKQHLLRKPNGHALIAGAQLRAASLSRLRRYLRRHRVVNFHRFLVPLAINDKIDRALTRWMRDFEAAA
jgi:hypothetical protein